MNTNDLSSPTAGTTDMPPAQDAYPAVGCSTLLGDGGAVTEGQNDSVGYPQCTSSLLCELDLSLDGNVQFHILEHYLHQRHLDGRISPDEEYVLKLLQQMQSRFPMNQKELLFEIRFYCGFLQSRKEQVIHS